MSVLHHEVQGYQVSCQGQRQVLGGVGQGETEKMENAAHSGVRVFMTITVWVQVGCSPDQNCCCDHCNYDHDHGVRNYEGVEEE